MRVLVDPETGELVEVMPDAIGPAEPYDYAQGKAAVMAATRERRDYERQYAEAQNEKADAEVEYRRALAGAILAAKDEYGATNAEKIAKGEPAIVEAKRRALAAEGRVHALRSRLQLCSEDRTSLHRLIEWSADVWRYENGRVGEGQS